MAAERADALMNQLVDGSLSGLLESLDKDQGFRRLVNDEVEPPEGDVAPGIIVGAPDGIRPALAAAVAKRHPVVYVVASGREAEETVDALRSWYDGDPRDIAQLEAWETLPHERLSPRADTVASRMAVFRRLRHPEPGSAMFGPIRILVMPVRSLIQPVVAGLGDVTPLVFTVNEELPLEEAAARLVENAYTHVDLVMDRGEFAVRGGLLDVFPPTAPHPVRIEFFGDEIDSIREFHASDQRTYGDGLRTIWATPCREMQLTDAIRDRARSLVGQIPNAEDMLESIADAIPVEGMESLLPALVDDMEPVAGMLPKRSVVMLSDPQKLERAAEDLMKTANEFLAASWHVAASGHGAGAPISFDQASFLDFHETVASLTFSDHDVWRLTNFGVDDSLPGRVRLAAHAPAEYRGDETRAAAGIEGLLDAGLDVTVTAAAHGTLARLKRAINETGITRFDTVRSQALDGFVDTAAGIALLTERDLTGRTSAAAQAKTPKRRRKAIDLMELKTGDYVVHEQHGIGRFVEMRQRAVGTGDAKTTREYLVIEYAPSKRGAPPDKLFIPTDQLDQVSKYIGAEAPKLNKLGGSDWAATKAKARKHVHEIAEDLVKLYSARQRTPGFAFSPDTPWQKELEDAFPYQETADQLTTIDEVKADMEKPIPMDRLICGDVGFGKTEIAVRAAFKAVQDSKQVAVLVPTTLLVQQHYETFSERYEGFPVTVRDEPLPDHQGHQRHDQGASGRHRGRGHRHAQAAQPQDPVQGPGPGHHRRGAALRRRTQGDAQGAAHQRGRALPVRHADPAHAGDGGDRYPRDVHARHPAGGSSTRAHLRGRLRGRAGHRGNPSRAAARRPGVLRAQPRGRHRPHGRQDPGARARSQGRHRPRQDGGEAARPNHPRLLASRHQRARMHHDHRNDPSKPMTQQSHDRLATIAQNTALGSGFDVAMKDLELRGTGTLLGDEQSGHIEGVGFDLYVRMVSEAVEAYKEPERTEPVAVSIDLPIEASIPVDYIDSDKLRLEAYRKLAAARNEQDLEELREELTDRYGNPPIEFATLFAVARLRNKARALGLTEIIAQGNRVRVAKIEPPESVQMRIARIYKGVQYRPVTKTYLIPTPFAGSFGSEPMGSDEVVAWTDQLLDDLAWKPQSRR